MPYAAEFDDLRQEVRVSTASTIVFWPKLDGSGNVLASPTAGHCTVEIFGPAGEVVAASANITPTTVVDVSRFDIAVPAIATLGEDYFAKLTWRQSGGSVSHVETIYFDVCREPWGSSSVSLNSLQSLCPDIGDRLTRQGARVSQTREQRASTVAHQARVELGEWLRAAIADDGTRLGRDDGYLRPRLIKDKTRLHTVETKLALALVFGAELRSDEDGSIAAQHTRWLEAAKASFKALNPLKYDLDDDLDVDVEVRSVPRFIHVRRVQS